MAKEILAGATNQTIDVFIQDSSATDGSGLTGLVYNSASLTCYYRLGATGTATALTLATQTVGGAHSDGGFVEIDATNMPGLYRLDFSDAMVATAGLTKIMLKGATNMAPCPIEIEVVSVNKYDAVRMGLTALPNANADSAGGLPISDAGGLDIDTKLANTNEITVARMGALTDWINGGRLDLLIDAIKAVTDAHTPQTGDSFARIGVAGAGLTDLGGMSTGMKAEVNAEVDTALATTTYAEPGQGTPAATASLKDKIGYLYKNWRNRKTQTATEWDLYNDDATTVDHKSTVSDNGTTADKTEVTTGP